MKKAAEGGHIDILRPYWALLRRIELWLRPQKEAIVRWCHDIVQRLNNMNAGDELDYYVTRAMAWAAAEGHRAVVIFVGCFRFRVAYTESRGWRAYRQRAIMPRLECFRQ